MTVVPFERPREGDLMSTQQVDSWVAVIADIANLATRIADTEFVPDNMRGRPAAIAAAMLTGREMGIGPMAALQHIHIVRGRPGQSAELMRALVLAQGHSIRYVDTSDTRCVVEGRRRGEEQWERVTFTKEQARQASIQLGQYPEDKLVARATSRLCRRKFADCVVGMPYTVEELEDLDDGRPVTHATVPAQPAEQAEPTPPRTAQRRARKTPQAAQDPPVTPPPTAQPQGPPLPGEDGYETPPGDPQPISAEQLTAVQAAFTAHGVADRDERLDIARRIVGRDIASSTELSHDEASVLLDTLAHAADHPAGFSGFLAQLLASTADVRDREGES